VFVSPGLSSGNKTISVAWLTLILLLVTFTTRVLPVSISSYPYNNDGLTECRIAQDILSSGGLVYPEGALYKSTHGVTMPLFNVLLAFVASVLGTSPFEVAQVAVAMVSVAAVLGGFVLAFQVSGSGRGALMAGLFLALFGTFVFTTGSTWKVALGMALFILLMYAYINRGSRRFFFLEIVILFSLPFVHHLATLMAFLAVLYMTLWAMFVAISQANVRRRHLVDMVLITAFFAFAYLFYLITSLDRLSAVDSGRGAVSFAIAFVVVCVAMILVLGLKKHLKWTLAPFIGMAFFVVLVYDYSQDAFSYVSSSPWQVLILVSAVSALIGISWSGLERSVASVSRYRAVPMALLLPYITLAGYAFLSGLGYASQQILYRSFDFADLSLALGIGVCVSSLGSEPKKRNAVIAVAMVAVLATLPFSYATEQLIGVRHDTQTYEVDAMAWLDSSSGQYHDLQSDERLSYIGMALFDFDKEPRLPSRLGEHQLLGPGAFYAIEEEWSTTGVNDFPRGRVVLDAQHVNATLLSSNVVYVGGPSANQITIFSVSLLGQEIVFGHHV